eukprot:2974315-Rhodomonas_salina.1
MHGPLAARAASAEMSGRSKSGSASLPTPSHEAFSLSSSSSYEVAPSISLPLYVRVVVGGPATGADARNTRRGDGIPHAEVSRWWSNLHCLAPQWARKSKCADGRRGQHPNCPGWHTAECPGRNAK